MKLQYPEAILAALPLAGVLCITPVVSAEYDDWQREEQYATEEISTKDLRSFRRYLDSHRETAERLYRNPDLINDRRFVREHEALDDWLYEHPDAAQAIRANPDRFFQRESAAYERESEDSRSTTARMSERDLRSFESYLDAHWETAQQLYENPDLVNDRRFVREHEALDEWLYEHPEAAQAIRANPHKFLWRERAVGVQDFLNQLFK